MAFLDQHKLAIYVDDTITPDALDFRKRVQVAIHKVATQVQGEVMGSFTFQQWQKRAEFSATIMRLLTDSSGNSVAASSVYLDSISLSVVTNATIISSSTDNDIEFQVSAIWDDLSGVTGQDLS